MMKFVFGTIAVLVILSGYEYPPALIAYEYSNDWNTLRLDECDMNMKYPNNFETGSTTNDFEYKADFKLYSNEPYLLVSVDCNDLDMNFSNDNSTTIVTQIQEKVMGYDDFIVENINLTKWRVDDQSTESFIFASGEHAHTGVVTTNEMVYVPYNNLHIIIKFTALYTEFDSPEIQELEKRLIDSIDLL
jgi:hypothetical protein